jgi:hypothetical protein
MKQILAAAAITALFASVAYAECGHQTTAQATAPDLVGQDMTAPATVAPEGVDDTLTGSTDDDIIKKKLLEEQKAD